MAPQRNKPVNPIIALRSASLPKNRDYFMVPEPLFGLMHRETEQGWSTVRGTAYRPWDRPRLEQGIESLRNLLEGTGEAEKIEQIKAFRQQIGQIDPERSLILLTPEPFMADPTTRTHWRSLLGETLKHEKVHALSAANVKFLNIVQAPGNVPQDWFEFMKNTPYGKRSKLQQSEEYFAHMIGFEAARPSKGETLSEYLYKNMGYSRDPAETMGRFFAQRGQNPAYVQARQMYLESRRPKITQAVNPLTKANTALNPVASTLNPYWEDWEGLAALDRDRPFEEMLRVAERKDLGTGAVTFAHQYTPGSLFQARRGAVAAKGITAEARGLSKRLKLGLGIGAGLAIFGLAFSGRKDVYNTITGMQEGGYAGDLRKQNTDFGSGWQGLKKIVSHPMASEIGITLGFGAYDVIKDPSKREVGRVATTSVASIGTSWFLRRGGRFKGRAAGMIPDLLSLGSYFGAGYLYDLIWPKQRLNEPVNPIEGMSERGIGATVRQKMTDFGSGYQGLEKQLKNYEDKKELEKEQKIFHYAKWAGIGLAAPAYLLSDIKHPGETLQKMYGPRLGKVIKWVPSAMFAAGEAANIALGQEDPWAAAVGGVAWAATSFALKPALGRMLKSGGHAGAIQLARTVAGSLAFTAGKHLYNFFSGHDDHYNTVQGMPETGIAGAMRKTLTDFGSGYQGQDKKSRDISDLMALGGGAVLGGTVGGMMGLGWLGDYSDAALSKYPNLQRLRARGKKYGFKTYTPTSDPLTFLPKISPLNMETDVTKLLGFKGVVYSRGGNLETDLTQYILQQAGLTSEDLVTLSFADAGDPSQAARAAKIRAALDPVRERVRKQFPLGVLNLESAHQVDIGPQFQELIKMNKFEHFQYFEQRLPESQPKTWNLAEIIEGKVAGYKGRSGLNRFIKERGAENLFLKHTQGVLSKKGTLFPDIAKMTPEEWSGVIQSLYVTERTGSALKTFPEEAQWIFQEKLALAGEYRVITAGGKTIYVGHRWGSPTSKSILEQVGKVTPKVSEFIKEHHMQETWEPVLDKELYGRISAFTEGLSAQHKIDVAGYDIGLTTAGKLKMIELQEGFGTIKNPLVQTRLVEAYTGKMAKKIARLGGVAGGAAGLMIAGSLLFSGKDDDYNIIEGMQEGGLAAKLRKINTEFGSGWLGIFSRIAIESTEFGILYARRRYLHPGVDEDGNITGKDDKYNTIEGMRHGGIAGRIRRYNTDFGSGKLDLIRSLSRAVAEGAETFEPGLVRAALQSNRAKPVAQFIAVQKAQALEDRSKKLFEIARGRTEESDVLRSFLDVVPHEDKLWAQIIAQDRVPVPTSPTHFEVNIPGDPNIPELPGLLENYYPHATHNIDVVRRTGRLLPGRNNAMHSPGSVGVYFGVPGNVEGGYGQHVVLVPGAQAGGHITQDTFGITSNESVRFKNLRRVRPASNQSVTIPNVVEFIPNPRWHLWGSPNDLPLSYDSLNDFHDFIPEVDFRRLKEDLLDPTRPLEGLLKSRGRWGELKEYDKVSRVFIEKGASGRWGVVAEPMSEEWARKHSISAYQSVGQDDGFKYYLAEDVSFHPYDPSHVGRPTKYIPGETQSSFGLAFTHAEHAGILSPHKLSSHRKLRRLSADLESMGHKLYIKGGTAREKLVSGIRPDWARQSKDLDLLVVGEVKGPELYDLLEQHGVYADISTAKDIKTFMQGADMSANQAIISVPSSARQRHELIFTEGAMESVQRGVFRYSSSEEVGRAAQRVSKFQGYYPEATIEYDVLDRAEDARLLIARPGIPKENAAINPLPGGMHPQGELSGEENTFGEIVHGKTPWGTKLDRLPRLAQLLGLKMDEVLASKAFHEALKAGTSIKTITSGSFGQIDIMKTMLAGEEFTYARKSLYAEENISAWLDKQTDFHAATQALMSNANLRRESEMMGSAGKLLDIIPTPYHATTTEMFMEHVPGETLEDMINRGADISEAVKQIHPAIRSLSKGGMFNADPNVRNILWSEEHKTAFWVDWGYASKIRAQDADGMATVMRGRMAGSIADAETRAAKRGANALENAAAKHEAVTRAEPVTTSRERSHMLADAQRKGITQLFTGAMTGGKRHSNAVSNRIKRARDPFGG